MLKLINSLLLARFFIMHQTEESTGGTTVVVVENDGENTDAPNEPSATEQAAVIVQTAQNLAGQMASAEEDKQAIKYSLQDIYFLLTEIRRENAEGITGLHARIDVLESMLEDVEDAVEDVVEETGAPAGGQPDALTGAAPVGDSASVVVEVQPENRKKKQRKFL